MSKLLDPQWLREYGAALKEIGAASTELGAEGFKQLMELEKQRIDLQSKARLAEIDAETKARIEQLRVENNLWWKRRYQTHRWLGLESSNALFLLAIFTAIAVALWR